jgi:hypothetical protein
MKKSIIRIFGVTGILLLILLAIQLTIGTGVDGQGWNWKPNDFAFAGAIFLFFGSAYEFLASWAHNKKQRIIIGIIVFLGLMFVWGNAVNDFDILERVVTKLLN